MKTFLKTIGLLAVLAFVLVPGPMLRAQDDTQDNNNISFQTFYDQLSSQGTWIQTNDYGYVFQPTVNDPNWRPYTYGHWVHTDGGMMWASDEPFGWATYHYGRWVNLDNYGWVWVPGYTWAPAWVSWRESDDYYGWAPLPPDTLAGIDFFDGGIGFGFGFHIGGDCDLAFGIGPGCYNFCPVAYIGDPYCWQHFANRGDNFAIAGRTRNITNINTTNDRRAGTFNRVNSGGPALATMNARSRTHVQHANLTAASTLAANGRVQGNTLSTFAPRVDPATARTARPRTVATTLAGTSVNRGTNINSPLAVNSRIRGASATSQQINATAQVRDRTLARAQVATARTHPSRSLNRPLTSLQANSATTSAGAPATINHTATAPAAESRFTGGSAMQNRSATPAATSPLTGTPATMHHTATASAAGSSFTGAPTPAVHRTSEVPHESSWGNYFHSSNPGGSSYHPSSAFHQSSAPVFHSSAPAYHPQASFRSAPAPHFGGGGAPAAHFSGGGHVGGGGGGGQIQGGGQRHH